MKAALLLIALAVAIALAVYGPSHLPWRPEGDVQHTVALATYQRAVASIGLAIDSPEQAIWAGIIDQLLASAASLNPSEQKHTFLVLSGLALSPNGALAPWGEWVESHARANPEFTIALLHGAELALGENCITIARSIDQRSTPDKVRLEVHKLLWNWSADNDAPYRTRKLLFREKPRANSSLRFNIIAEAVSPNPSGAAEQLMIDTATGNRLPDRVRREAVNALARRDCKAAAPFFDMIFYSESRSAYLRKEALLALLEVDRDSGLRLLSQTHTDPLADPVITVFLGRLREQYGVSDK